MDGDSSESSSPPASAAVESETRSVGSSPKSQAPEAPQDPKQLDSCLRLPQTALLSTRQMMTGGCGAACERPSRGMPLLCTQSALDQSPELSLPGPRPVILAPRPEPEQGRTQPRTLGPDRGQPLSHQLRLRQGQALTSTRVPAPVSVTSLHTPDTAGLASCPSRSERTLRPCNQSRATTCEHALAPFAPSLPPSTLVPNTLAPRSPVPLAHFHAREIPGLASQFGKPEGPLVSRDRTNPFTTAKPSTTHSQTAHTAASLAQAQTGERFSGSRKKIKPLPHDELGQFLTTSLEEQQASQQVFCAQGGANLPLTAPQSQDICRAEQSTWAHAAGQQLKRSRPGSNQALPPRQASRLQSARAKVYWQGPGQGQPSERPTSQDLLRVRAQITTQVPMQIREHDAGHVQHLQVPAQAQWQFHDSVNEQPLWQPQRQLSEQPQPQAQAPEQYYQAPDQSHWQSDGQIPIQSQRQLASQAPMPLQKQSPYQPPDQPHQQRQNLTPAQAQYQGPIQPQWQGQDAYYQAFEPAFWQPQYPAPQQCQLQTDPGFFAPPFQRPPETVEQPQFPQRQPGIWYSD